MIDDWVEQMRDAQQRISATRGAVAAFERESAGGEVAVNPAMAADRAAVLAQLQQDPETRDRALERITDQTGDAKRVFVVHGRSIRARNAAFQFLRALGLHPVTWEEAVRLTGRGGSPTTLEVVRAGLGAAAAILVLLTPDEVVSLRPELAGKDGNAEGGFQPRPNVLLEAGMALALAPQRTVLVRIGQIREVSDISGINFVSLSNDAGDRVRLLMRLEAAGCKPVSNEDFVDPAVAGDFDGVL